MSSYIELMRRGKDAKPEVVGRVMCDDEGNITFDLPDEWKDGLNSIEYKGKEYTPADGMEYLNILPQYYHGDYLWATKVKAGGGGMSIVVLKANVRTYSNEHTCRLIDPGQFGEGAGYARVDRQHNGHTYSVIFAKKSADEPMQEQAYRYPIGTWPAAQARAHCKSHKGRFGVAKTKKDGG